VRGNVTGATERREKEDVLQTKDRCGKTGREKREDHGCDEGFPSARTFARGLPPGKFSVLIVFR